MSERMGVGNTKVERDHVEIRERRRNSEKEADPHSWHFSRDELRSSGSNKGVCER